MIKNIKLENEHKDNPTCSWECKLENANSHYGERYGDSLTNQEENYHESKKVTQLCPTLCDSMDYRAHGILQARILEWVAFPFSRGSSQPRDRTQVSHIAGGFLPAEPQGKPKNTGVGSLSLLQQIFPIQESNRGLLRCRQVLYQPSYHRQ